MCVFVLVCVRSLVTSIFLYTCESWTLTVELQRRIQAMEMRCYRKILRVSYKDHVTNEEVRTEIHLAIGTHEDLLTIVKRHKLQWYRLMSPVHQFWPKPSCKAQWKEKEDKADKGRGGKTTSGNGQAWSSASPRGQWRKNGENWLQNHLWCPNDPRGRGIDDDDNDNDDLLVTLSPPEWFCIKAGSCVSHFHVSLIV